jgi:hypothetical protein
MSMLTCVSPLLTSVVYLNVQSPQVDVTMRCSKTIVNFPKRIINMTTRYTYHSSTLTLVVLIRLWMQMLSSTVSATRTIF